MSSKEIKINLTINKDYLINFIKNNTTDLSLSDDELDTTLIWLDENIYHAIHDCVLAAVTS